MIPVGVELFPFDHPLLKDRRGGIGPKVTEIGMIFDLNSGPIYSDLVRCGSGQWGEDLTKDYPRLPKMTSDGFDGFGRMDTVCLPFLYQFSDPLRRGGGGETRRQNHPKPEIRPAAAWLVADMNPKSAVRSGG